MIKLLTKKIQHYFQTDYKQTKEKSMKTSYTICRQNGKISIIIKKELRKKSIPNGIVSSHIENLDKFYQTLDFL